MLFLISLITIYNLLEFLVLLLSAINSFFLHNF
nr:MAG TPA: hypothetical protein [Caudoviricetes sp.]